MSFTGPEFVFFLPLALLVYWALPRRTALQNAWLLLCSYVFYWTWDTRLLGLLVAGSLLDYLVTGALGRHPGGGAHTGRRRTLLALSLTFDLGALAFFKYEGFFADSLNAAARAVGLDLGVTALDLLLPFGISFYTLQRIGYVIDVYWGRSPACKSLLQFLLFCCFFPQLTSGPIARGSELLPQLAKPRHPSLAMAWAGASAILLGFILKAFIAQTIGAAWVDPVFAAPAGYSGAAHWLALAGFAMQVFADFGGYSLMAIGIARTFGIELPANFNFPFLSRSLPEIWRRWHMSLNRWLFDFIYTPLVTSRGWFRGRFDSALVLTFLASGLWHGASWPYLTWGIMQGFGMIVHRHWDEFYRARCRVDRSWVALRRSAWYGAGAGVLTAGFFVLSMLPFRAHSIADAATFGAGLIGAGGAQGPDLGKYPLLCALFIAGYHALQVGRPRLLAQRFLEFPAPIRGMVYGAMIVVVILKLPRAVGTFIYQQF